MKRKYLTSMIALIGVVVMLTGCAGSTETDAEASIETTVESEAESELTETAGSEVAGTTLESDAETEESETVDPVKTETTELAETGATELAETGATELAKTETTELAETESPAAQYTYTDLSETRYAKSAVNVRDLPSADGNRVGGLSTNQEVAVTGQCNETGWYRIKLNDTDAYVSNNYLVTEKVPVTVAQAPAGNPGTGAGNSVGEPIKNPATGKPYTTEELMAMSSDERNALLQQMWERIGQEDSTYVPQGEATFERAWAEQIFASVNAERAEAGIHELVWDENLYEIAKQRCDENDVHVSVRPGTGENYAAGFINANDFHNAWKNSPGHHDNYLNSMYTTGAVAIKMTYDSDGYIVASVGYEVFSGIKESNPFAGTEYEQIWNDTHNAARTDIPPQEPTGIVDESADTHQSFTNSEATTGMTADKFREKLRQENEARHKANGANGF